MRLTSNFAPTFAFNDNQTFKIDYYNGESIIAQINIEITNISNIRTVIFKVKYANDDKNTAGYEFGSLVEMGQGPNSGRFIFSSLKTSAFCQVTMNFIPLNKIHSSTKVNVNPDPNHPSHKTQDEFIVFPEVFCN